jgi:ribonuclease-3 family protein
MNVLEINPLVLAYLGDSIYEQYIREYLIRCGIRKVNELQNKAKDYVSAKSQSAILEYLIDNNILTDEEIDLVRRARNTKVNSHPKNTDILTYKHATALEALIGYLYLNNNKSRIDEIINHILEDKNECNR